MKNNKIIIITGETASGKTAKAIELAKKINGEIICADSRTVYREMNIGTAKPTKDEQKEIKHWLLDIVNPDEKFTVASWQKMAKEAIFDIQKRGKTPIIVGGTGLYINSLIFNYDFDKNTRDEKIDEKYDLQIMKIPRDKLNKNIEIRAKKMLENGLICEVNKLVKKYGENAKPLQNNAYGEVISFQKIKNWPHMDENGKIWNDKNEYLISRLVIRDRQLAKKQRTWIRGQYKTE